MIEIKIENLNAVLDQIERLGRGLDDNRYLLMKRLAGTMFLPIAVAEKQLYFDWYTTKPFVCGGIEIFGRAGRDFFG